MSVTASPFQFDSLQQHVSGPVLRPGDEGYAEHTGGFNLAVTSRPAAVVAARSAQDVRATVRFATDEQVPVAVQATGHGATPGPTEGVLISTRDLRTATVDTARRTATVSAGARWSDVFAAAAPHGLGGLCGSTTDVGVVGFTLGGGLPVLGRAYGYACDQVLSMQVVTADGRLRTVDESGEPDLF